MTARMWDGRSALGTRCSTSPFPRRVGAGDEHSGERSGGAGVCVRPLIATLSATPEPKRFSDRRPITTIGTAAFGEVLRDRACPANAVRRSRRATALPVTFRSRRELLPVPTVSHLSGQQG